MSLRCGTAIREITPAYPVYLHGYANRDHLSTGIAEPIYLSCLALDDGARRVLIVACDMIGIEAPACQDLYALLEKETGIGYPAILLSCSHTHFAPALHSGGSVSPRTGRFDADPRFVEDFCVKLVEAARESLRTLHPARLETARLQAPQVLFNRRTVTTDGTVETNFRYPLDTRPYTFSPIDSQLLVLRLRDDHGIGAALVNFGCHPVTGGASVDEDHFRISSDYPFYVRQTIAGHWNCPVYFTLGAAGDAVPIDRYGNCRQRIGQLLGHTAILAERVFTEDPTQTIGAAFTALEAETIISIDPAQAPAEYQRARTRYAALENSGADPHSQEYHQAAAEFDRAQSALSRSRLYPENRTRLTVQFLRLGSTTLVGLPFEVLSLIALRLKARFPNSALVSCAGGYQGYLPLAQEYPRGGYEATERSTHFAPGTADRLLQLSLEWLAKNSLEQTA